MNFMTKLMMYAVSLVFVLGAYRLVQKVREPASRVDVVDVQDVPDAPLLPHPPRVVERAVALHAPLNEVRIISENRAMFMALRDDQIIAGLTDSIRAHIHEEMRRELAKDAPRGVGAAIGNVVVTGVNRVLDKEIAVPMESVRDITYEKPRIVIMYRDGKPAGVINFESIKTDGDRTLLEQFSEAEARRFVQAVKVRIK
jgi:hypothetical protein